MDLATLTETVNTQAKRLIDDLEGLTEGQEPDPAIEGDPAVFVNYPYEFRTSDTLFDDGLNSLFAVSVDECVGMLEIASRLSDYDMERNWVYIPELAVWLNDRTHVGDGVHMHDHYLRSFLANMFPMMAFVHMVPDQILDFELAHDISRDEAFIYGACPTVNDLLELSKQVKISNKSCSIAGAMVTHHGYVSYGLTPVARKEGTKYDCASTLYSMSMEFSTPAESIRRLLDTQTGLCRVEGYGVMVVPAFQFEFTPFSEIR